MFETTLLLGNEILNKKLFFQNSIETIKSYTQTDNQLTLIKL